VESTKPKQVYIGKLGFVSERTKKVIIIISSGGIWTRRKSFGAPVSTFGTDVNLPLTFTYVPTSGRSPQVGHLAI
jgi:hypothetical protein